MGHWHFGPYFASFAGTFEYNKVGWYSLWKMYEQTIASVFHGSFISKLGFNILVEKETRASEQILIFSSTEFQVKIEALC